VYATGWLMYLLFAVGIIALLSALYLIVDALRRPAAFAGLPETRWSYLSVGAIYVVAYGAWSFLSVRAALPWVGDVVLVGVLAMFVAGSAYLLRVVFPKAPAASADPVETAGTDDDLVR
jgi:predicted membrane metal-binding protein